VGPDSREGTDLHWYAPYIKGGGYLNHGLTIKGGFSTRAKKQLPAEKRNNLNFLRERGGQE